MVRVPMYKPNKGQSTRIELRTVDSACNPYLAFAVMLAAGMKGIEEDYELPREAEDDVWSLTERERTGARHRAAAEEPVTTRSRSMERSELVAETLGEHVFDFFLRNKRAEWEDYRAQVYAVRAATAMLPVHRERAAPIGRWRCAVVDVVRPGEPCRLRYDLVAPRELGAAAGRASTRPSARPAGWRRVAHGRRPASSSTCAARTPATSCPTTSRRTTGCWSSAARWAPTTTTPTPGSADVKELVRRRVGDGTPVLGHLPRAPAASRSRSAATVGAQPARPAGRCARRRLDRRRRTTTGCSGRSRRSADVPARAVERRRRDRGCPTAPSLLAHTGHGELQAARFAPRGVGRAVAPRGRRGDHRGPWAEPRPRRRGRARASTSTRYVRDIGAARDELRATWRPLADAVRRGLPRAARATAATVTSRDRRPGRDRGGPAGPARLRRRRALGAALRSSGSATRADALVAPGRRTADPDQALPCLAGWPTGVDDRGRRCSTTLVDDEGTAMRLLVVLGASAALGDHLVRHPEHWRELTDPALGSTRPTACAVRADLLAAVGADPAEPRRSRPATDAGGVDALRVAYRRLLLRLAARDLTARRRRRRRRRRAGRPRRRHPRRRRSRSPGPSVGERRGRRRLAVIAMGKCGGHELNYVSDVDVDLRRRAGRGRRRGSRRCGPPPSWPSHLMRICSDHTGEGTIWPVDAALRPEGKAGPAGAHARQPPGATTSAGRKTWEFQALLKARPVAGDLDARRGVRRRDRAAGLVGGRARRTSSTDVQAMRRRVDRAHPGRRRPTGELKLGPGGLRDVEFAVQLLQLVHGRADDGAAQRRRRCRRSSRARPAAGTSAARTAPRSTAAYRFLRTARAPAPAAPAAPHPRRARRRGGAAPARPLDGADRATRSTSSTRQWRRHGREVRRLHEKLFYRPLLAAVAQLADRRGAAHARRRRGSGWRRSATPTRPARCATSRR